MAIDRNKPANLGLVADLSDDIRTLPDGEKAASAGEAVRENYAALVNESEALGFVNMLDNYQFTVTTRYGVTFEKHQNKAVFYGTTTRQTYAYYTLDTQMGGFVAGKKYNYFRNCSGNKTQLRIIATLSDNSRQTVLSVTGSGRGAFFIPQNAVSVEIYYMISDTNVEVDEHSYDYIVEARNVTQLSDAVNALDASALIDGNYSVLKRTSFTERYSTSGVDSSYFPVWINSTQYREYTVQIPEHGEIRIGLPSTNQYQSVKWFMLDGAGKSVKLFNAFSLSVGSYYSGSLTVFENYCIVNAEAAGNIGARYVSFTYPVALIENENCYCRLVNSIVPEWLYYPVVSPYFVLPDRSVAVVGHEWNMYFDNVVCGLSPLYSVICAADMTNAKCLNECLRVTPIADDIGTHQITVSLVNNVTMETVDKFSFSLIIIADSQIANKTVMFIGDSLTDMGIYPAEIQHHLSNGGLSSIGTRTKTVTINNEQLSISHEGRAGWNAYDYTHRASYKNSDNAFWNPSENSFDFGYYMNRHTFSDPDIVCIGLGTNSLNDAASSVSALNTMIQSIKAYNSDIKILISLVTPPATQDGCGMHGGLQSSITLKNNGLKQIQGYLGAYESVENVHPVELYFNLDTLHDYPTESVAVSSRNPMTVTRQNNNVHPSEYGFLKMADVWYNNILYYLTVQQ